MTAPTPSQTAGPFVALGTAWNAGAGALRPGDADAGDADAGDAGRESAARPDRTAGPAAEETVPGAVTVTGRVLDGAGEPVTDAMVEFWQADEEGRFPPDTPPGWTGFARALTGPDGGYRLVTGKPGPTPGPGGRAQAPHIDVSIFARGLLHRLVARIYFSDEEEANHRDPVLAGVDPSRRDRLVAHLVVPPGPGGRAYRFDFHLQGPQETVFFAPW
ncbi:MAG: protocatechuate 3,4-dioxygenase subunit alpha [Acidimicrobiales bacterium]